MSDQQPQAPVPPEAGSTPPSSPPPPPAAPPSYPQHGAPSVTPAGAAAMTPSDERMWAMLGHLGGIVLGFLAPLIVWLMYRERSAFVDDQAKESLNFQITVLIAVVVSWILTFILIGMLLLFVVFVANLVLCIMAGLAANKGERYRYPVCLRLVK